MKQPIDQATSHAHEDRAHESCLRTALKDRHGALALALLLALLLGGSFVSAQSLTTRVPVALPQPLLAAMRARLTVSTEKTSGRTIPASHCRHAPGGCEQRLSAFAEYLSSAASKNGLDPWLLAAMALKESGLNPFAKGSLGEMGILQINPERRDAREVRFMRDQWYRNRCRKQPGACQQEIVDHAAQVLSRSFERCNREVVDALGAYNTGRCGGNDRYAKRVLSERAELMRAAGLTAPELSFRAPTKRRPRG